MSQAPQSPPVHPVVAAVGVVDEALAGVAGGVLWSVGDGELAELVVAVHATAARLEGLRLAVIAEVDARELPRRGGATSTAAWLRARTGARAETAAGAVRTGRALADRRAATAAALAGGQVSGEQAAVVAAAVDALPAEAASWVPDAAEAHLLGLCDRLDPRQLAVAGRRVLEVVDPDHADRLLADQLTRQEEQSHRRRDATVHRPGDGTVRLGWTMPEVTWAALSAGTAALAAPRPATATGPDPRTAGQRLADALDELVHRALAAGDLPASGGTPTTVLVGLSLPTLTDALAAATLLGTGDPISPTTARRLACDAHLIPYVLGPDGQVLDLGRTVRLFTPAQRLALTLRDRGCAFPGCDRPPDWCQAHHLTPWWTGGPSDLTNAALLCGHHHRLVHTGDWTLRLAPDGHPEAIPPPWIDPHQKPRRNTHHRQP